MIRTRSPAKVAAGTFALIGVAAALLAVLPAREPAGAVTIALPKPRPASLVEATSGSALTDMRAVGEQAKVINAALPFANAPLHAAQSFALAGTDLDQRRALLCLTQTVYYEAGNEPLEGRRAVAQVVLNRLRHPAFPKSICGVVYQGAGTGTCQFTFVCDGALYRRPAEGSWREAEQIARAALSGYVERSIGEATHYHADYVAPRWAPLLAKVAAIGQHIFYRWPGSWGQPAAFTGRYIGEPRDPLTMRPPPPAPGTPESGNVALAQADLGPQIARAADDVGGLLDTSKGWTLHIPGPDESGGAAAKTIASQQGAGAAPAQVAAASGGGAPTGSR
ncbi:MAG TPA: cell wall hydrolase [Sphingomicrobium sp.]|nr:cell wall hydrolase [Sphingomicrobium sp.]